jgi:threonine/homoserine efflux transporter RhtA
VALPHLKEKQDMNITLVTITPLVALIAGILILVMPRLLNYIVAIYLIIIGVIGLAGHFGLK